MTERLPYWIDTEAEGIDSSYSVLRGPDGFECFLGEPEDCTWTRDGWGAVARLNDQHAKLEAVFKAFLIYRRSEGCSCCRDTETHEAAEGALGELFGVPRYSDDSGVDWPEPTGGATGYPGEDNMIRAVPVVYFIEDEPSHMAFLDTVTDKFLTFYGYQVFDSWQELADCCDDEQMLERIKPLCPGWFFEPT